MMWPNDLLLSIKNVTKTYPGGTQALKGVSLDIKKGEVFGLLGPNGAGKTTLSSIIASLHPVTTGEINIESGSIYNDLINYRYLIGLCPQKPNIDLMLTMEQNLIFAGRYFGLNEDQIKNRIDYLSSRFGLTKYLKSKASMLSGGYRQRFVIARALIHQPKLVILDEPTVGLDPHIRFQLWDFIKNLRTEGVSVLLTTHYLDEAEALSDRVCILDKGQIILIDTPENLKKSYGKDRLEDVFIQMMSDDEVAL
jgi:ABC-2 type transport system ATP-binding protein